MSDDYIPVKLGGVAVLFLVTLTFSFIPYRLRKYLKNNEKLSSKNSAIFISSSLCFGAGILLATVFLHMLKETRERLVSLADSGYISVGEYPLAELIFCLGFFFIYSFEEAVLNYAIKGANPFEQRDNNNVVKDKIEMTKKLDESSSEVDIKEALEGGECKPDEKPTEKAAIKLNQKKNFLRSVIFMVALYMHTFFEGLAIGVAASSDEVWLLVIAFTSHKIFIVFSISLELLELNISRLTFCVYTLIFAIVPPVGCTVGILLTKYFDDNDAETLTVAILTGISGGTILFVIFCEILERERSKPLGRIQKLISFILGFLVMALMMMVPEGKEESSMDVTEVTTVTLS